MSSTGEDSGEETLLLVWLLLLLLLPLHLDLHLLLGRIRRSDKGVAVGTEADDAQAASDSLSEGFPGGLGLGLFVEGLVLLEDVVVKVVVDVDKGALDVGQALELALQGLAHVVGDLEGLGLVHDDVDLGVELVARVVGAHRVDFQNPLVVRDAHVDDLVEEVLRCRLADQIPYVFEGGRCP